MESSSSESLFDWIFHSTEAAYAIDGSQLVRHQEFEPPAYSHSCRIVFDPESDFHGIAQLILANSHASIAAVNRQSDLLCVEIVSDVRFSEQFIDVIVSTVGQEYYPITQPLAWLDKPGLLVMDMDSTAIEIECIDELASMAGVGEAVAAVTEQAMQGELDFEQSLRSRVAKLQGASSQIIDDLCQQLPLMPGLTEMVATLQQYQWRLVLASGGFTPFVGHLKQLLNLDAAYANELVIKDGCLSGEVVGEIVDAQFKADTVKRCAQQWQIAAGQRLAIGDGANDIPMIKQADCGFAFHAKPKLKAAANLAIDKLDLRALPFLLRLSQ
ncbi:phosphoserine phosphatase SerB [Shewanella waksmanii]|uniref:phosphoserine phosphatase SerB n=1 Tax=Shewanella waksmanii TaxID=213783 RepID=UPI00373603CD